MRKVVSRLGEVAKATNGMLMTIVAYRSANDLDVQFEDGTIIYHKKYSNFILGNIAYPVTKVHIGERYTNKIGLEMLIIEYRNFKDVDVQFSDGTIVQHKLYQNIVRGEVVNPNLQFGNGFIKNYDNVGRIRLSTSGVPMEIIKYHGYHDISVKFASGYLIDHTDMYAFLHGMVRHPFPYQLNCVIMEQPAYIFNEEGNFYCHCMNCGHKDIMTVSEMQSHICNI